ncbi:MAG: anhydro-N-acetylmuramic acid kinase [Herminiimonas sp.]|nr:anhydro-N-acetylmuramic acid kinase [Herminiimonas sp.]
MKRYIGLMSGTSLDGIDGVVTAAADESGRHELLAAAFTPFDTGLRAELLTLQQSGDDEIHREAMAANLLARHYADCVARLLSAAAIAASDVTAIGVHGQTIRHRPELGYTCQTNNPSLLAELSGIDVIADFRSRDVAAGGQGAPLVPAYHQAVFSRQGESRVVVNIGGITNISILEADSPLRVAGFDTGPGNMLMDAWIGRHRQQAYDADGAWAASGTVDSGLLAALRSDPFFSLAPPKSTGRDLFGEAWLDRILAARPAIADVDVQATLAALTATTLADAIVRFAPAATRIFICGGGAYNGHLLRLLASALPGQGHPGVVESTAALGVSPNHVEALAFAWLAERFVQRQSGNLPAATGATGPRILGALYPA